MKTFTTILATLALGTSLAFAADEKPAATEPVKEGSAPLKPAAAEAGKPAKGEKRDPEVAFKRIDKDSDSAISLDEFKASPMGRRDEAKAVEIFGRKDTDKDGKLTLEEFSKHAPRKEK